MSSLQKIKTGLTKRLEEGGVEAPSFEASLLLRHFLGLSKEELLAKDEIEAGKSGLAALQKALDRRLKGEPLQYILGRWEFMGLPFLVGPGVLIPRGDTEVLAERAIWDIRKKEGPVSVLDLCCGSGCLGIAVAAFCERAQVTMWDISEEALKTARENISLNNLAGRVRCEKNDALNPAGEEKFDCIVCNPPYLTAEEMENLQKEVSFEPKEALFGGEDGLRFYRAVCENFYARLRPGGSLYFEGGAGQKEQIAEIMERNGFCRLAAYPDYAGHFRVICGKKC